MTTLCACTIITYVADVSTFSPHLLVGESLEDMAEILVVLLPPCDVCEGDPINSDAALEDTAIGVAEQLLSALSHVRHLLSSCTHTHAHTHTHTHTHSIIRST